MHYFVVNSQLRKGRIGKHIIYILYIERLQLSKYIICLNKCFMQKLFDSLDTTMGVRKINFLANSMSNSDYVKE